MCGRYVYSSDEDLKERFKLNISRTPRPNWNAAPTQTMPVIRGGLSAPVLEDMTWGLIPPFSKDGKMTYSTFNARSEGVFESRVYRGPIRRSRCLVPFTLFYEWKREGGSKKQPYAIKIRNVDIPTFAGIYETWKDSKNHAHHSYSILTTTPNMEMSKLHDRMPVILHREDEEAWLSDEHDEEFINGFLKPYEDGMLEIFEVSKQINSVKNNSGELIKPLNSQ